MTLSRIASAPARLGFAMAGMLLAVGTATAEEPRRIFGTHSCDRGAMAPGPDGAGRGFANGDLVGSAARRHRSAAADNSCIGWTLDRAPSNVTVRWDGGDGTRYAVTPIRTYETVDGERCRDYAVTVELGKRRERLENAACRDRSGAWRLGSPYADGIPSPHPWEAWAETPDVPPPPEPVPSM